MALTWAQVHRLAMLEAARAFSQLGIDRTLRIDPFRALEAEGVLVIRRPLDHLAGIYLPAGGSGDGAPGVLVNISHPVSRQRFTAAHELAHHRRDREAVLDEDTEFIARGETSLLDRERIADAFAAWFLMPKELISHSLLKLGLDVDGLDPVGAYGLALECGTSYEATVRHLAHMRLITESHRDSLLRIQPQRVKRSLGALDVASDSRRDVWIVKAAHDVAKAEVQEGDALVVEVEDLPSSGYVWQPATVSDGLSLVRDDYPEGGQPRLLGGNSLHRFMFRVLSAGRSDVHLVLRRPWQDAAPADERFVEVDAEPRPTVGVVNPLMLVRVGA